MSTKVADNVYSVGVVDWNVRSFHGNTFITKNGATYNSYLVCDKETALIDVVHKGFEEEFIHNISTIMEPEKIKHVILNHLEPDHSGSIEYVAKVCKNAKFYGTAKLKEGLNKYYNLDIEINIVKTGDSIKLGDNTLTFIEVPMIHWPDSMITYCQEKKILFSNDAFGQHIASNKIFTDEIDQGVLEKETKKYYANILWPLGNIIDRKLNDIIKMNLDISIIAPSHGMIWRKEPTKIIEQYLSWAKNTTANKAVIVYETMWGSTEKMARAIVEGLTSQNIEVKLFDIASTDFSELAYEMLDAKAFIIGSSTHDNEMLSYIAGFLHFLKGMKPKNRIAIAFGSYGWAGGAVKEIAEMLTSFGVEVVDKVDVKFKPNKDEVQKCYDIAVSFAQKLK
ncbi:MAG: FprA family A-type flavoprotein [Endomicrobiia bacterium]|nr:FprA family A-type flavoprotein [Endomicrobiaceae bacterium]MDD3053077.1 FprA family A-type flavoprotein [Endomicrobiaceae bacterium]MDD3922241.1 FprA family A-type flavoprotein [Endomicrobiaceae bacterium]